VTVTVWSLSIGGQESTPPELIVANWELTLQVGVTVDVELLLQLAVATYVPVLNSLIDDGPLTERPVKSPLSPPPPPPPPPHVTRIIARNAKSNEAGRYVLKIFLISISLLLPLLVGERERFPLGIPKRVMPRSDLKVIYGQRAAKMNGTLFDSFHLLFLGAGEQPCNVRADREASCGKWIT
jgi:hypothetical protein